ncbi:MAG: hypothetical protein H7835_03435 [Magnetococcus sp. XQGC-1]
MDDRVREQESAQQESQESAQLELDGMTVLLAPHPEDPFQDIDAREEVTGLEEEPPLVGPDEWLEE